MQASQVKSLPDAVSKSNIPWSVVTCKYRVPVKLIDATGMRIDEGNGHVLVITNHCAPVVLNGKGAVFAVTFHFCEEFRSNWYNPGKECTRWLVSNSERLLGHLSKLRKARFQKLEHQARPLCRGRFSNHK